MTSSTSHVVRFTTPSIDAYRQLRVAAGMSDRTIDAATRGLANTLFAVQILVDDEPVGMGRVIGDGGCFFQVVDVAVLPTHQGKGLGKAVMRAIVDWLEEHVPASGYVSLMAVGKAHALYEQFGFASTASVGMIYKPVR